MRKTTLFNDNWKFSKQPLHTSYEDMSKKEINWNSVSIPHDWLIYDVNQLYEDSEGWYRKYYTIKELDKNCRTVLRFEGVYMNSFLYVNGNLVGTWKYGYSTFEMDITDYLREGTNEIMVQVIHESPNSRWYSGAGIYRNVWLSTFPNTHLVSDGIYISTKKIERNWSLDITTEVSLNKQDNYSDIELQYFVHDKDGMEVSSLNTKVLENNLTLSEGELHFVDTSIIIDSPILWDIKDPVLYTLTTRLVADGTLLDENKQSFGFRTVRFDSKEGFFLNDTYVKLHGVCEHHDLGCLGAAFNKEALRRKFVILKNMGVNALRTSHNMPAVEFMDLADEMGFLVVSEGFDMWERKKTTYDYSRFFLEWAPKDVASWVRRDRNHPSLIMWSIGNEIYDTHADERGQELTKWLCELVTKHDPRYNGRCTIGSNYMPWENAQKCADIVKFAGYNYAERYYDLHHKEHPDWIIYGSETSSTVQSRGIYHFPFATPILADDDEQCSSLGNSTTSWGAKSTEQCIIDDRNATYCLGQFIWTGFDYIGEPTPYHTKNSYFGQIDTAGFKKDSYYIYQAEWTSYKENPMVHIFPYWDFSIGQLIDIRVCSNAPKIELFFNDNSLGTYEIDHLHGDKLLGEWQIPYTPGTLRAVAYDELGNIIAEDIKTSFKDVTKLQMVANKNTLDANGSDLVFIEITGLDEDMHVVENGNNRVHITVDGPGVLVGLDNGNSTDYDQYKGTSKRMFSGKLLAVISSTFTPGDITVTASSPGLDSVSLKLTSLQATIVPGSCEPIPYEESPMIDEIPIRKLEIICPDGNKLDENTTSLNAYVKIYPENATYEDISWRVTNAAGIDTNLATIEQNGREVKLTALGDGLVFLRCLAKNGAKKNTMYSHMEFSITGLGSATINPYEFVSAGLYTYGTDDLSNGNERGISTSRDGKSIVSFERVDFGDYGSDEITLPIFDLESEEFPIEIWEGIPGREGASLITIVTYNKGTIWNVYQEETYKLPRRLKGLTTISFVLYKKIHLKGFIFKYLQKAFQRLSVLDYTSIYGDSYTLKESTIEDIGNNVSIVFENMDFKDKEISKLTLCGHSPIDKNTIHIRFTGKDGETVQLIEFEHSNDYVEKTFDIKPVTGNLTVTFVFLPGCQFNFEWFQFQ